MKDVSTYKTDQIVKGFIILFLYIIIKTFFAQKFALYKGLGDKVIEDSFLVIGGMFLFCTVLLIFIGLKHWAKIPIFNKDTSEKIIPKNSFMKNVLFTFGLSIIVIMTIFLINTVVYMLFISFNLVPITDTALENENMFISYLLEFIFASLVIAPCEEILFRQFLQNVCQKYFGIIAGIFMQSVLYAVSFLGFYPLDIWYFILLPFLYALVWGIIKYRSKKLLPIILGHAIAG